MTPQRRSGAVCPSLQGHCIPQMLSFGEADDGAFDITISGLGVEARVEAVKNTLLKAPKARTAWP